tara:strand:+ start:111 stop:275 length:165 start_codon:yes stop_codon:yes gene_type:complete
MAVLTSKITPVEKRCKIFELTKVNLLSFVGLALNKYVSVVVFTLRLAAQYPLLF